MLILLALMAATDPCAERDAIRAEIARLQARLGQAESACAAQPRQPHAQDQLTEGVARMAYQQFSSRAVRIDFDVDTREGRTKVGDNVEHLYRPWGVVLDTENAQSYVAADAYVVGSPSKGLSAANQQPRWTADLFIDFVEPSEADSRSQRKARPVHRVGFWVAHVFPGGTGVIAYDGQGQQLAKIYTRTTGSDFLGLSSRKPIARLRVFRVPRIDANFTIDDLIFEVPQS